MTEETMSKSKATDKAGKAGMIKVGGRMLPCRVTMGALKRFKALTGQDVSRMQTDDVESLVLFVWCCVASACRADGVEFGIEADEFADHLEAQAVNEFYAGMDADAEKKS